MAEMTTKIGYRGRYGTNKVKIYTTATDIAGEDAGLRIQTSEGIGYIPCVDGGNKRATEIAVQTKYGMKYLASNKKIPLDSIASAKFRYRFGASLPTEPTATLTMSGSSVVIQLKANTGQEGWVYYDFDFYDASGNKLNPNIFDENFTTTVNFQNRTYSSGHSNSYGFEHMGIWYVYGNIGTSFSRNEVVNQLADVLNRNFTIFAKGGNYTEVTTIVTSIVITSGSFTKTIPLSII